MKCSYLPIVNLFFIKIIVWEDDGKHIKVQKRVLKKLFCMKPIRLYGR